MKYDGKLYGHIGGRKYFPLVQDTKDVDDMRKALEAFMSAATRETDILGRNETGWNTDKLTQARKLGDAVLGRLETKEMAVEK
jgi:hypothetical protein